MFFPRGKAGKDMGTMTFLFLSTSSLLFSLKCQLLLYSRGDYKCQETWPLSKKEEMTGQWKPLEACWWGEIISGHQAQQIQRLCVLCNWVEQPNQSHDSKRWNSERPLVSPPFKYHKILVCHCQHNTRSEEEQSTGNGYRTDSLFKKKIKDELDVLRTMEGRNIIIERTLKHPLAPWRAHVAVRMGTAPLQLPHWQGYMGQAVSSHPWIVKVQTDRKTAFSHLRFSRSFIFCSQSKLRHTGRFGKSIYGAFPSANQRPDYFHLEVNHH